MNKAILTICIGEDHQKIAQLTQPTFEKYAKHVHADLIKIDQKAVSILVPQFEKFQIFNLLNKYERILFLDADLIIREDCPDLFEIVPEDALGAFNEGAFTDRLEAMKLAIDQFGFKIEDWKGQYYNTGVMIVSRRHKFLFQRPVVEIVNFYEQTLLNVRFIQNKIKMHDLNYKFNRMTLMDKFTGEPRLASYIIHYAGCPTSKLMSELITKDLANWQKDAPQYEYYRNIAIFVHGGLGDEICAEPVIRYIVDHAYPKAKIHVITWYPRLFVHLPVSVYQMGEFKSEEDVPYYRMDTLAPEGSPAWKVISVNLSHVTDYVAMMCLRKILPDWNKKICLQVDPEDIQEVQDIVGEMDWKDWQRTVLVHPGRGWPSKTFPKEYWNEIIKQLKECGYIVIIIGKDISKEQGTVPIATFEGVKDVRNILSLGGLIAIISKAQVLVTNDSSPVHIAGAFDNHIVLIPSSKHPDHVLPYRQGIRYHKAVALYKKLTCAAIDDTPTNVHGQNIDYVVGDIMEYLPDPKKVVEAVAACIPAPA